MTMLQGGEATAAGSVVKDTTTQSFVKDVIEESKRQPVLVDFWAEWCGPCKQLGPVLEKAVGAAKGKVKLVKMDIDKHPSIPGQLGIQSIPAVFAFVNGQPVDGFLGAVPESPITAFIKRLDQEPQAPTMTASNQQDLIGSTCAVCQRAAIQQGGNFFRTNDFLVCPTCLTEFHRAGEKYILKKIPRNYERWLRLEGQALSREEIQRIAGGDENPQLASKERTVERVQNKNQKSDLQEQKPAESLESLISELN